MRDQSGSSHFVYGGYDLARAAVEPGIRAQVRADYAAKWNALTIWGRIWLRREMEAEIERRVRQFAKPESFY